MVTIHRHKGTDSQKISHKDLRDFDNDDHKDYIKKDGSRAFTGEQSIGTNKLTNVVDPTADQDAATKKYVDDKVPTGSMILFAHTTAPSGWLECNGQAVSRTTYATLFAKIGTTYGVGDGSTTFNVPNLKGKVPVGLDTGDGDFDAMAEAGGAKEHTLTEAEMPAHNHSYVDSIGGGAAGGGSILDARKLDPATTGSKGGGNAHNNLQPYITLKFIIKT